MSEGDRGSASVIGAFVVLSLVMVTATVMWVGAAVAARHRVQAAADLAALAGAAALVEGDAAPASAAARAVGDRMGAVLATCVAEGWDLGVRFRVTVRLGRFGVRGAVRGGAGGAGGVRGPFR
ncbi:Rv3654c family TadE-like protein [Rhodococcoides corynebacterioides]|uniref:Rv3654c family TadE-like protein n=1 Tax=Rhodococcoides corynebacterioides TaxID=53972 RepID=UPI0009EDEEF5|nr:Rv3654c family TadE-like protein [Rhodococcus corynebacterioides]